MASGGGWSSDAFLTQAMEYVNDEQEEPQQTPEEYLAERKKSLRTKSWWAIGAGLFVVAAHLVLFAIVIFGAGEQSIVGWSDLLRSLFFILALMAIAGGIYGLREANRMTLEDLIPSREAIEFASQFEFIKPYFSYFLVGAIAAVYITQMVVDAEVRTAADELPASIARAGLIKPAVVNGGEWWRLLTGATVHGSLIHIFFNGYALLGFGRLIEYFSNRAHLAIVMLLSIIAGSLASTYFMPLTPTVGASGGIMGLIGFLAIYGSRRRRQLMPGFLKAMLTNIAFIAAFGLIAFSIIDNFAHFGGLAVGVIYGLIAVPKDLDRNPREVPQAVTILGYAAIAIFAAACVFSMLLMKGTIG